MRSGTSRQASGGPEAVPNPPRAATAGFGTGSKAAGKVLAGCLALALSVPGTAASSPGPRAPGQDSKEEREEYSVKAQILLKLIPYVRWPDPIEVPGRPLVIAVVGRSPFDEQLDQSVRQAPVIRGRPLKVIYAAHYTDDLACDVLFLCPSLGREARGILAKTKGKPVLTVADDERLSGAGVMVSLLLQEDNRTRLVVNRGVAVAEGFALNSQLLKVAKVIDTPRPTP